MRGIHGTTDTVGTQSTQSHETPHMPHMICGTHTAPTCMCALAQLHSHAYSDAWSTGSPDCSPHSSRGHSTHSSHEHASQLISIDDTRGHVLAQGALGHTQRAPIGIQHRPLHSSTHSHAAVLLHIHHCCHTSASSTASERTPCVARAPQQHSVLPVARAEHGKIAHGTASRPLCCTPTPHSQCVQDDTHHACKTARYGYLHSQRHRRLLIRVHCSVALPHTHQ